jgi:hypothetical protein
MKTNSSLYKELKYKHSPSLVKVIKDYFADRKARKLPIPPDVPVNRIIPLEGITMFYFAIIVDGVVEEVIRVNGETANLFNRDFKLIEYMPENNRVEKGWLYSDGNFHQ